LSFSSSEIFDQVAPHLLLHAARGSNGELENALSHFDQCKNLHHHALAFIPFADFPDATTQFFFALVDQAWTRGRRCGISGWLPQPLVLLGRRPPISLPPTVSRNLPPPLIHWYRQKSRDGSRLEASATGFRIFWTCHHEAEVLCCRLLGHVGYAGRRCWR